ncbi:MAG: hypothetical protein V4563_14290 [Pseudomonadota bacterium]
MNLDELKSTIKPSNRARNPHLFTPDPETADAHKRREILGKIEKKLNEDNHHRDPGPTPELEPSPCHGTLGEIQVQARLGQRVLVRVTAFRRRLLDEDNLCEKFHCDLLRYAGLIFDDCPGETKIEVAQQKVGSKEREFVRIEITS